MVDFAVHSEHEAVGLHTGAYSLGATNACAIFRGFYHSTDGYFYCSVETVAVSGVNVGRSVIFPIMSRFV